MSGGGKADCRRCERSEEASPCRAGFLRGAWALGPS